MLARHFSIAILCAAVFAAPILAQDAAEESEPTNNIETIDAIGAVSVDSNDAPLQNVVIESVYRTALSD